MEAFVYCWFDKLTKKKYIGYHSGTEDDGYVCSSKTMLEEFNKRPLDFEREILKRGSIEDMRKYEIELLSEYNAASSADFYNLNNGGYHIVFTDEVRKKMSEKKIGFEPANKGKKAPPHVFSKELNKRRSESLKGIKRSEETKKKMSESQRLRETNAHSYGNWSMSETGLENVKKTFAKQSTCPYCGKTGKHGNMIRWHFDNCKK